jgi:hypothetical protein
MAGYGASRMGFAISDILERPGGYEEIRCLWNLIEKKVCDLLQFKRV